MEQNEQEIDGLVLQAQRGNKEAFGQLYDVFMEPIYRYIYFRVSRQNTAEDLTSEVFFKALKNLQKYKKRTNMPFSAWLFRIAKNVLIDHYRKNVTLEDIPETHVDESQHADSVREASGNIDKKRILEALSGLPEMQTQAIVLKYFSDRSNAEIASILDKSETAVRILQSRGLKKLKDILDEK